MFGGGVVRPLENQHPPRPANREIVREHKLDINVLVDIVDIRNIENVKRKFSKKIVILDRKIVR